MCSCMAAMSAWAGPCSAPRTARRKHCQQNSSAGSPLFPVIGLDTCTQKCTRSAGSAYRVAHRPPVCSCVRAQAADGAAAPRAEQRQLPRVQGRRVHVRRGRQRRRARLCGQRKVFVSVFLLHCNSWACPSLVSIGRDSAFAASGTALNNSAAGTSGATSSRAGLCITGCICLQTARASNTQASHR